MKNIFLVAVSLFSSLAGYAQHKTDSIPEHLVSAVRAKAVSYFSKLPELKEWLHKQNPNQQRVATDPNHVYFRWPMRVNSNYDDIPSSYYIANYMDQRRTTTGQYHDWYCYQMNYDGHEGNDYSIYPFWWRMQQNENTLACAGAPGIVIEVLDSINNSENCLQPGENTVGNHITVIHSDSSIARYYHIKTGTARVRVNQFIKEGQILAAIASSGRTSNPHLHFDLQYFKDTDGSYDFMDPFVKLTDTANDCNDFTNTTWWQQQEDYVRPKLMRVMTHSGVPEISLDINSTTNSDFCTTGENVKAKNQFSPGETITLGVALTHVSRYDSVHFRLIYPNGTLWTNAPAPVPNTRNGANVSWRREIYLTRNVTLPADAPEGTYTLQAELIYRTFDAATPFNPQTATQNVFAKHYFTVGCQTSKTLSGNVTLDQGHIVSNNLNSTQVIQSGNTRYQSANYIQLNPNFEAKAGSTFKARIRDCNFSD